MAERNESEKRVIEQQQHHQQHHHHHHQQQQQQQQKNHHLQQQNVHHPQHHQHHQHQHQQQQQQHHYYSVNQQQELHPHKRQQDNHDLQGDRQPHRHNHHHHHQQQQQQQQHHHHHQQHPQQHQQHHHHGNRDDTKHRTTVLIAMDGSPHSFYAFDWYMSHVHKAQNDVIVVHSSQSSHLLSCTEPLLPSVVDTPSPRISRLVSKEEEEVNKIAQMIKGKLTATGVRGKLVRLAGDPGPTIVELANEHRVDCIVTGSRGMGTIKRALIGSVSDYILHHATCPVLVCRHKENSHSNNSNSGNHA